MRTQPWNLWTNRELAPPHERESTFSYLSIQADYWLEGLRRNVVIGWEFEARWQLANFEDIGNLLFVIVSFVAATHWLTLSD